MRVLFDFLGFRLRAGSVFFRVAVDATDQEENRADGLRTFTTVGRLDGLGRSVVFSFARVRKTFHVWRGLWRERRERREKGEDMVDRSEMLPVGPR